VLDDQEKRFSFVIAEQALRTWPGSGDCMPGQLARLLEVAERPNVRLGVVPRSADVSPVLCVPLHGFTLYDDAAVTVETFAHELTLTNEDDVRIYVRVFEGFQRAAVFGGGARALVERVMRDYEKVAHSIH
ncbi:MAG: hypothetical protein JWN00_1079, partial [Actinomycetia bacterium]|nr:hypothetical protein [Actinomycetes bacterium]